MIGTTLGGLERSGLLEYGDGYWTKQAELASCGFRILRAGDIRDGQPHFDSPDFVSAQLTKAIGRKQARVGDVVLTTKGTVGRTALVTNVSELVVYSPQLCFFRPDPEVLLPRYLYYWFSSPEFHHQSLSMQSSTDMAPYISLAQLGSAKISVPNVADQRAMSEVLGALDDKIVANDRVIMTLEALLKAHYETRIADSHAQVRRVDDVVDLNPSYRIAPDRAAQIAMQDLPSPRMVIQATRSEKPNGGVRFSNGDTLLARITPCLENGKTGYVSQLADGEVGFGSTEYIVMRSKGGYPLPLSYFIATDERFRGQAIMRMVGTSGRQRVRAGDIGELPILITDDPVTLNEFGGVADACIGLAGSLNDESRTLAELRDTLLPALMDGSIRVKDAIATAGEVL